MSKYDSYQTSFTSAPLLCGALKEVSGFDAQFFETPVELESRWEDAKGQMANIVVPAAQSQTGSALGFKFNTKGSLDLCVNDMDTHQFGDAWLSKLKTSYGVRALIQQSRSAGTTLVSDVTIQTDKGTRPRLEFTEQSSLL